MVAIVFLLFSSALWHGSIPQARDDYISFSVIGLTEWPLLTSKPIPSPPVVSPEKQKEYVDAARVMGH